MTKYTQEEVLKGKYSSKKSAVEATGSIGASITVELTLKEKGHIAMFEKAYGVLKKKANDKVLAKVKRFELAVADDDMEVASKLLLQISKADTGGLHTVYDKYDGSIKKAHRSGANIPSYPDIMALEPEERKLALKTWWKEHQGILEKHDIASCRAVSGGAMYYPAEKSIWFNGENGIGSGWDDATVEEVADTFMDLDF